MMLAVCQQEAALSTQYHIWGNDHICSRGCSQTLYTSLVFPAPHLSFIFTLFLFVSRKIEFIFNPRHHFSAAEVMNPLSCY